MDIGAPLFLCGFVWLVLAVVLLAGLWGPRRY